MKITFIGLGIMGKPMALNLLNKGIELTLYNKSRNVLKHFKNLGATIANSSNEAVHNADIVFTMLSTPTVVNEVAFGSNGFVANMKANTIWINCSTVNPTFSKMMFTRAKANKINYLEAPVAGSKPQAEEATLVFFVSGDNEVINIATPFLKLMGQKIVNSGKEVGNASNLKMLVNMMLANSMVVFTEAILFGVKAGLNEDFLLDLIPNLPVTSPFIKAKAEMIKNESISTQFPLEWMLKDIMLVCETATELNQHMLITEKVKELFSNAYNKGLSRSDFAEIFIFLKNTSFN